MIKKNGSHTLNMTCKPKKKPLWKTRFRYSVYFANSSKLSSHSAQVSGENLNHTSLLHKSIFKWNDMGNYVLSAKTSLISARESDLNNNKYFFYWAKLEYSKHLSQKSTCSMQIHDRTIYIKVAKLSTM